MYREVNSIPNERPGKTLRSLLDVEKNLLYRQLSLRAQGSLTGPSNLASRAAIVGFHQLDFSQRITSVARVEIQVYVTFISETLRVDSVFQTLQELRCCTSHRLTSSRM